MKKTLFAIMMLMAAPTAVEGAILTYGWTPNYVSIDGNLIISYQEDHSDFGTSYVASLDNGSITGTYEHALSVSTLDLSTQSFSIDARAHADSGGPGAGAEAFLNTMPTFEVDEPVNGRWSGSVMSNLTFSYLAFYEDTVKIWDLVFPPPHTGGPVNFDETFSLLPGHEYWAEVASTPQSSGDGLHHFRTYNVFAVPEPSTLILVCIASFGFVVFRRR